MTTIAITGNATATPELKQSQSGTTWTTFSVAVTPREKLPDGTWGDGDSAFYRVAAFDTLAENVVKTLATGMRVTVVGQLKPRDYEHEGQKRTSLDVTADSVAVDLRFATAVVSKSGGNQRPQQDNRPDPFAGGGSGPAGAPGAGGQVPEEAPF